MPRIDRYRAYWVLDSRGYPTVRVEVWLEDGSYGMGTAPAGASTGTHEAVDLRDGNPARWLGKGVDRAVKNARRALQTLKETRFDTLQEVDQRLTELDGTPNKSRLGANALLPVSIAVAQALARHHGKPLYRYMAEVAGTSALRLPVPLANLINGGRHADNPLLLQEFMVVPVGFGSFGEALRATAEVFHHLRTIIKEKGHSTAVGDEGGFAPQVSEAQQALDLLMEAIGRAGYRPGEQVCLAVDAAASELYEEGRYRMSPAGRALTAEEMVSFWEGLVSGYPIVSIEDPLAEDDWEGWRLLTERLGDRVQLVGDDLFVTNRQRLQKGIDQQIANAILIKPNQIGTLTETLQTVQLAHQHGYTPVMSHRSGETEDTTIADLAVALACPQIKTGSVCRGERTCKYNRLLQIEQELGDEAVYAGREALRQTGAMT